MIGQFGELTFFHKGKQTRTFTDFKSTIGLKTEEHPVVGWKGRLEVTGEELDEVDQGSSTNSSGRLCEIDRHSISLLETGPLWIGGASSQTFLPNGKRYTKAEKSEELRSM